MHESASTILCLCYITVHLLYQNSFYVKTYLAVNLILILMSDQNTVLEHFQLNQSLYGSPNKVYRTKYQANDDYS